MYMHHFSSFQQCLYLLSSCLTIQQKGVCRKIWLVIGCSHHVVDHVSQFSHPSHHPSSCQKRLDFIFGFCELKPFDEHRNKIRNVLIINSNMIWWYHWYTVDTQPYCCDSARELTPEYVIAAIRHQNKADMGGFEKNSTQGICLHFY